MITERAWAVLRAVPDPELPTLSLCELGIVREVNADGGHGIEVVLTPTYSGCPATEVIEQSVTQALADAGIAPARVTTRRAPAWTSDWITAEGRGKLREAGIAPPGPAADPDGARPITVHRRAVECPRCGSADSERLSAFGSTACKAIYRCRSCREPFELFKAI